MVKMRKAPGLSSNRMQNFLNWGPMRAVCGIGFPMEHQTNVFVRSAGDGADRYRCRCGGNAGPIGLVQNAELHLLRFPPAARTNTDKFGGSRSIHSCRSICVIKIWTLGVVSIPSSRHPVWSITRRGCLPPHALMMQSRARNGLARRAALGARPAKGCGPQSMFGHLPRSSPRPPGGSRSPASGPGRISVRDVRSGFEAVAGNPVFAALPGGDGPETP